MAPEKCFVAKLLQTLFIESSGVNRMQPYMFANHIPPASAKLSYRINFKSLEENESHYRHWILFALYSKLKAIDRRLCFVLFQPLRGESGDRWMRLHFNALPL